MLARKRPDIQIVGDDLHPLAQVRDFAPYVAKIKASGADTVITGNWGSDLTLLVKAANDAGLTTSSSTPTTPASRGTPTALGPSAAGRVYAVAYADSNMPGEIGKIANEFKAKFNDDYYTLATYTAFAMLSAAMAQGQVHRSGQGGAGDGRPALQELQRRGRDAQDRPPAAAGPVHLGLEEGRRARTRTASRTPATTSRPVKYYEPYVASTPTSCQMKRPGMP